MPQPPRNFVFDTSDGFGLGDVVVLSGVLRDLAAQYPDVRFRMAGSYPGFWDKTPHASHGFHEGEKPVRRALDYSGKISEANDRPGSRHHYLVGMAGLVSQAVGRPIRLSKPHGEVCTLNPEKFVEGSYWVLLAGGKTDFPTKIWSESRYQRTADLLADAGINLIQAGTNWSRERHFDISGVESAIGCTGDVADLFRLIRDSDGVICGVTGAMHVAAALGRPAVVLAGGREGWWWEAYTNEGQWPAGCSPVAVPHAYLHAIGKLDCCKDKGCWKHFTSADQAKEARMSERLVCPKTKIEDRRPVPECLLLIEPEEVVAAVLSYNTPRRTESMTVGWTQDAPKRPVPLPVLPEEPTVLKPAEPESLTARFTVFVMMHGDYFEMHERNFKALLDTTTLADADIRVATNQIGRRTAEMLMSCGRISHVYDAPGDPKDPLARRKYPAMREMLHDATDPIETPYVVWLDDDVLLVDPDWLARLRASIEENHPKGRRLYGRALAHDLAGVPGEPVSWFRQAPWWHGRELLTRSGKPAPNGSCIPFVAGYFWAMHRDLIFAADVPDLRLNHNGGDIAIGAQVHQAGFGIQDFNPDKRIAWCPTKEAGGRRGYSENFPWQATRTQGFTDGPATDAP